MVTGKLQYPSRIINSIKKSNILKTAAILLIAALSFHCYPEQEKEKDNKKVLIDLPEVKKTGNVSVEEALTKRRSYRDYRDEELTKEEISQLLWAAQGKPVKDHFRKTSPSAGATYPLEVYLITINVNGIEKGYYRYLSDTHQLEKISSHDLRDDIFDAALKQLSIKSASALLLISGVYERTTGKYGERGIRYVYMEAGHTAQNVYLQGAALKIGTVVIGAFQDDSINRVLGFGKEESLLYIMPLGKI